MAGIRMNDERRRQFQGTYEQEKSKTRKQVDCREETGWRRRDVKKKRYGEMGGGGAGEEVNKRWSLLSWSGAHLDSIQYSCLRV